MANHNDHHNLLKAIFAILDLMSKTFIFGINFRVASNVQHIAYFMQNGLFYSVEGAATFNYLIQ